MKDEELHALLREVPVPARTEDYWDTFPAWVGGLLHTRQHRPTAAGPGPGRIRLWLRPALAMALAMIAGLAGVWFWGPSLTTPEARFTERELETYRRVWTEASALFPHQIRAIVFGPGGPRIDLADTPNLPISPALVVRGCGSDGCVTALTLSGQSLDLEGESFEVLATAQNGVLIAGIRSVWPDNPGSHRFSARSLD
jgi:hypothetical protein